MVMHDEPWSRVLRLFREQPSTLDELALLMRLAADSPASPAVN